MTPTTEISSLCDWSPENGNGIRTARPGQQFWSEWNRNREGLKRYGVRCYKSESGDWICDWIVARGVSLRATHSGIQTPHEAKRYPVEKSEKREVVWSDEQNAIFDWFEHGTKNLVIRARAGTGKTTTAKEGFTRAPDERMLYAVFNKRNQVEAQSKISDPRVEVKTLHSVGFACLARFWSKIQPDDSVETDRVKDIAGADCPDEVISAVLKIVGFLKNCFLEPAIGDAMEIIEQRDIFAEGCERAEKGSWNSSKLADASLAVLELSKSRDPLNRISFNDMVWLPVVLNLVRPMFDLVLVDEAQDMNLPQLVMAQRASRGRVCVVGDDRQCIYGFRGAVQDGLNMMRQALSADEVRLTTTYRCPKSVVELAAKLVPDYCAASTAPQGLVDSIGEQQLAKHAKIGDVVLSRTNAQLMPLCLGLLRRNIPARIEGRDIGKQLVGIVRKLKSKSVPDFLEKLNRWENKMLSRARKRKNADDIIQQVRDQAGTLAAVAEGLNSVSMVEERILSLFQDSDKGSRPAVLFSTVHKAKGMEWHRVFILRETFLKRKTQEEENIYYVALTRSRHHLTFIGGEKSDEKEENTTT